MTELLFSTTKDGMHACKLEDVIYVAIPSRSTGYRVATIFQSRKEPSEVSSQDGFSSGQVDDIPAFEQLIRDIAGHRAERAKLGRHEVYAKEYTPWDTSDAKTVYAEGVIFYTTPSHGGFFLTKERQRQMPVALRNKSGWYEEDCEWAKVALAFPALFTSYERKTAEKTVKQWFPEITLTQQ